VTFLVADDGNPSLADTETIAITVRYVNSAPVLATIGEPARPAPAFEPEGMVHWLNGLRSEGKPEATLEALLSPGRSADDLESAIRRLVEWWGG
jgi:hypothetical protein